MNLYDASESKRVSYQSDHYVISVETNSLADNHIESIVARQERCLSEIEGVLGPVSLPKIEYYFFDDAYKVASQFRFLWPDAFPNNVLYPVNAFCWYPNYVFATYNAKVKAVGHHEDTHLAMYEKYHTKGLDFLNEGIAVALDAEWNGLELAKIAAAFHEKQLLRKLPLIVEDENFRKENSMVSYPLAGAFCQWLLDHHGFLRFEKLFLSTLPDCLSETKTLLTDYVKEVESSCVLSDRARDYVAKVT